MSIAVLDADVLFQLLLRDTLLRAAAAECFRVHWSSQILDEVTRNLVSDYGMEPARAGALRAVMEEAFPDANVEGWQKIEPKMRNHPKDRRCRRSCRDRGLHYRDFEHPRLWRPSGRHRCHEA